MVHVPLVVREQSVGGTQKPFYAPLVVRKHKKVGNPWSKDSTYWFVLKTEFKFKRWWWWLLTQLFLTFSLVLALFTMFWEKLHLNLFTMFWSEVRVSKNGIFRMRTPRPSSPDLAVIKSVFADCNFNFTFLLRNNLEC